jgi:hypothetical protein
VYLVGMYIYY